MSTIVPPSVAEPFCAAGVLGTDYNNIPVPSQVSVSPELASFTTGFPPATRLPKTSGGIPPRGKDMNGILRIISAHTAWVAAGGRYPFNSDVVTVSGGYPVGAIIQSVTDATLLFLNLTANNTNNPDSVLTGWMALTPQYSSSAPTAGTHADNVIPGASDYYLDVDTTAGNITLNGFVHQRNGQRLTITNTGANTLTIGNLAGSAGNQVRASSVMTLLQNDSVTIQWVKNIGASGAWVIT
jgi:hypothetical protein